MAFSELDIWLIKSEILSALSGRELREVLCHGKELFFIFKGAKKGILVSVDPQRLRMHLALPPCSSEVHSLTGELKGYKLKGMKVLKGDRIAYLLFEKFVPPGEIDRLVLAVELTGKYSNVILVDEEGTIVACAKEVPRERSRFREVLKGRPYVKPPRKERSIFEFERMSDEELRKYVEKAFPFLLKLEGELRKNVEAFLERALQNPSPAVYYRGGQAHFHTPVVLEGLKDYEVKHFSNLSEALEDFYSFQEEDEDETERTRRILLKELERLRGYERYKRYGELLLENIGRLRKGVTSVEIEGEKIELDPTLTPQENVERYFKLYKKMKRGFEKVQERLRELEAEMAAWDTVKRPEKEQRSEKGKEAKPYREFVSPGGFKVLVGKNRKSNDFVTFQVASRNDLFFHVKNGKGAHVILKKGGRNPSTEDILFAARLALLYSNRACDGKGEVSYTLRKYVKRTDTPGLVLLEREKVIEVRLDEQT